jgi:aryl-alcohol dehydrogenase-like predicted oxidoreductase
LIGRVLGGKRDQIVLASKCGIIVDDKGRRAVDCRPESVKRICEESLGRLQTDVIDLYYLHRKDPNVPIEESIGTLAGLVEEGKIKTIGLSEMSSINVRKAHAVYPITAVQSEYSLWTRNPEKKVLPACRELGIKFVAFSPLARAFLTGKLRDLSQLEEKDLRHTMPRFQAENFTANLKLLDEFAIIAEENGCTMAQLALAWLLAQGPDIFAIPGTKHLAYATENAGGSDISLSDEDVIRLDQLINPDTVAGERYNEVVNAGMDSEQE